MLLPVSYSMTSVLLLSLVVRTSPLDLPHPVVEAASQATQTGDPIECHYAPNCGADFRTLFGMHSVTVTGQVQRMQDKNGIVKIVVASASRKACTSQKNLYINSSGLLNVATPSRIPFT